jgi:putative DNA primase/helicase
VVAALGDVVLVVVDPLTSYLGRIDSHRTSDVRAVLEPLGEFAATTGVAVLLISHPPKAVSTAINSVTGSLAFVAMPRMVFLAVPEVGTERNLLLPVKNNLGPLAPGLGYRLIQRIVEPGITASHVAWDTTPVRMTADEALAALREGNSAMSKAREFLTKVLADGPLSAAAVTAMAVTAGIAEITLKRARKELGVVSTKPEFDGGWMWNLPSSAQRGPGPSKGIN